MKKVILSIIIILSFVSCSLFDMKAWEEVQRENKERGLTCTRTESGHSVCGYTR